MRLPGCNLYRYAIAQQLVGAQIGLIQVMPVESAAVRNFAAQRNVRIRITRVLEVAAQKSASMQRLLSRLLHSPR